MAATLLVGATAAAAHASTPPPVKGASIDVTLPGHTAAPDSPGAYNAGTVYAAQALAARLAAHQNVTIELQNGTYRLPRPLTYTTAQAGRNGHTITWEAAPGAHPVLSGARQVTAWHLYDASKNIWVADVGKNTDSRQLYVNGNEAPLAAIPLSRSDVTFTATGLTINNSALDYLASLPDQNQIEFETLESFTDRYSPVESISGSSITMQQPAWANNNWGYDTTRDAYTLYLENSLAFMQQPGQWSLDSATGQLFYKAAAGKTMQGLDVELPRLQSLVDISGSYDNPAQGLTFQGIQFSGTTWLQPSTDQGYADQQNGTFLTGTWQQPASGSCTFGCQLFEATREHWGEMPGAVQVSAASHITFTNDAFTNLGEVGLGVGQDADANASGIGLGASDITVDHNTFSDDAGNGVTVGGVQTDAHHPSNPAMTDQNITISNNLFPAVGTDYKEVSAILSTYVTGATIVHNQIDHTYDGIDLGWGWGMNDPGGSQDYKNRGTYNYQPLYTTPTTEKDNLVAYNLIFDAWNSIYNLSASPGTVIHDNYMYDDSNVGKGFIPGLTTGLYLDESSRYVTLKNNVVQDTGKWAFANTSPLNNTNDNVFDENWYNGGQTVVATGPPHNNVLTGNVLVSGYNWPAGAQQVISGAGVQKASAATTGR